MQNEIKLNFDKIISLNNFSDSQKKIKQENFNNYFEKGLPNKRNEDWKFSDINQIISKNFDNLNFIVDQNKIFEEKNFPLDFEHNKISFVDGKLYDFDFKHETKDKILVDQNLDLDDTIYQNTLLNLNWTVLSVVEITSSKYPHESLVSKARCCFFKLNVKATSLAVKDSPSDQFTPCRIEIVKTVLFSPQV